MAATEPSGPVTKSEIRPELQALRALAVAVVVVFHLWPTLLTGGYIGVDVFFVLSGFLITSHLLREVARNGRVSLTQFWARRIRRLLPAAALVLVACTAITIRLLPRTIWEQSFEEIRASALYVINWFLAFDAVDYMAAAKRPSPVQHFWSLAVEEQFYLVWPVLIAGALGCIALLARLRRRASPSALAQRVAMGSALLIVFGASLVFCIAFTAHAQPAAYFVTPTRAWEFAAGGLLAFIPEPGGLAVNPRRLLAVRAAASWAGLAMIVASAAWFTPDTMFPGYAAILPVAGTVLCIWAGDVPLRLAPTTLGRRRPLQIVGDASYSIYLWHWPLIVAAWYIRRDDPDLPTGLVIIALSIALAVATKFLVEDPFRTRPFWTRSRPRTYALAGALMVLVVGVTSSGIRQMDVDRAASLEAAQVALDTRQACYGAAALAPESGCEKPFAVPTGFDPAFGRYDRGPMDDAHCRQERAGRVVVSCVVGRADSTVGMAVIGNSHAGSIANGLAAEAQVRGWRLETFIKLGCLGIVLEQVADYPTPQCVAWTKDVLKQLIATPSIKVVVFQSYYQVVPTTFTKGQRTEFVNLVRRVFTQLVAAGKKVVVLSDVPGTRPHLAPDCVAMALPSYDPCARPLARIAKTNLLLDVAAQVEGVTAVNTLRYFCDQRMCHALVGGVLVYRDTDHLTVTYATTLVRQLGPRLAGLMGTPAIVGGWGPTPDPRAVTTPLRARIDRVRSRV